MLLLCQPGKLKAALLGPAPRAPCYGDSERVERGQASYATDQVLESL